MTRLLKALAATVVLLALAVVPPGLLVRGIGNPWPEGGVSLTAPVTDEALLGVIAAIVWVLWAQLMVCVLVEALAALTDDRIQLAAPLTLGVQRQLARRLVSAVVMATLATPLALGSSTAFAAPVTGPSSEPVGAEPDAGTAHTGPTHEARTAPQQPAAASDHRVRDSTDTHPPASHASEDAGPTVTVMRLDSLWSIAERVLGDGDRWVEIAELNEGRLMVDGTRFLAADQIRPGWQLAVPGSGALQAGPASTDGLGQTTQVVVEPGDTLSGIAAEHLGDAAAYPSVFEASRTTFQPDGLRLSDPDVIEPGWALTIPGTREPDEESDVANNEASTRQKESQAPAPSTTGEPDPQGADAPWPESPEGEATTTPDGVEDGTAPITAEQAAADEDAQRQAPWMLAGLTGGGVVLAGGLLLGLRARRRARVRTRTPGRVLTPPPQHLVDVEKSLSVNGRAATQVADLDALLRQLSRTQVAAGEEIADLAAVQLSTQFPGDVVLHLAAPTRLLGPWRDESGSGLRWSLARDAEDAAESNGPVAEACDAPYPLLVTVGHDETGAVWLLNLERLGHVRVTGDPRRGDDFARHLIAEVAMNTWSHQAEVNCIGIGAELVPMSPHRITFTDPTDQASVDRVLRESLVEAEEIVGRSGADPGAVRAGRTALSGAETWPARMLVVRGERKATSQTMQELEDILADSPAASASALIVVDSFHGRTTHQEEIEPRPSAVFVAIDEAGQLVVDSFGLTVRAVGLTEDEAHGCAELITHAETAEDIPVPVFEQPQEPWQTYATQTGALRAEHTKDRHGEEQDVDRASSLLPAPDEVYMSDAAVVDEDLRLLAPKVADGSRAGAVDSSLDTDLTAWFDQGSRRPQLQLMGPVTARTYGKPLAKQRAYMTELLAYLALRRSTGATPGEVATAFNISPGKTREYVRMLRSWLGANPATGQPYLPHADKAPAAQVRGVGVYQLDADVLVDMDLFRRLRLRGESAGIDGIADLERALLLVTGRPFDQLREGGWSWLLEGERLDHFLAPAVADVALIVVTHNLQQHELAKARAAAEIATLAAPDEEASRLSLSRVCLAEGNREEADRMLREDVLDRTDDGLPPSDLPERTRRILRSHRSLAESTGA